MSSLGLYVHLPFCPYICPYCDFAKWPMRRSAASRYLEALYAEIDAQPAEPAKTIFFGGGTPNAYSADEIAALLARLRATYDVHGSVSETTIEINPELVAPGDFERYVAAGITRVSIGVQSFDPAEIKTLGRKHTPEQIRAAVEGARAAGIASISLDLIFAVPGQTLASWERSLRAAIDLGVDHISTYGLTIEEGTPYERWYEREPSSFFDDASEADLYDRAIAILEEAGFEHYEISNFAKPGHRSEHNANYWRNGEYAGLGVGAASYRGGERSVHTRELNAYVDAALERKPIPAQSERLAANKAWGEGIMLALRTAQGVGLSEFKERYGVDLEEYYARVITRYVDAGLLEIDGGRMRLTRRGKFLANDVCGAFVTFE
ncbi:MAG: radical SAM family heme chaperone HemW [Candidatus Eremiobacteraeota bacterium]|nr:radical SAM family heme chaperone HemW [Candidatus Eremiobacteraeota bacterium]